MSFVDKQILHVSAQLLSDSTCTYTCKDASIMDPSSSMCFAFQAQELEYVGLWDCCAYKHLGELVVV